MSDLLFSQTRITTGDLVFGETDAPAANEFTLLGQLPALTAQIRFIPEAQFALVATLPPLTVEVDFVPRSDFAVAATFPSMAFLAEAEYRSNTDRPLVGKTDGVWQVAIPTDIGAEERSQDNTPTPVGWENFWQKVIGFPAGVEHRLPDTFVSGELISQLLHEDAAKTHATGFSTQQDADRGAREELNLRHQDADLIRAAGSARHQDGLRDRRASLMSRYQPTLKTVRLGYTGQVRRGARLLKGWAGDFENAIRPPIGITIFVPPAPPGEEPCYTPNPDLLFEALWDGSPHLLFVCRPDQDPVDPVDPTETVIVPIRSVYIVINNVTLRRGTTVIPCFGMSISIDVDSWTWGFSATLPGQAQADVESNDGNPVQLDAVINGTTFRVIVESISRERTFGSSQLSIRGRGLNAILDAPYAPVRNFTQTENRTANQLMLEALTLNGISLGWNVEFGLEDWNIPGNVWSHQGTYISAIKTIAEAAGGYVQPHANLQTLRILPRYPVAPWNWNTVTPNFELPASVTTRESIEWVEKPDYNRVFVSGQGNGVLGQVTRQGTAGTNLAPMVTDALITTASAARQRGLSILADTGKQADVSLRLPVLNETGVIRPGQFVRYVDGASVRLGLVRSNSVSVDQVEVWQTIGVETHA